MTQQSQTQHTQHTQHTIQNTYPDRLKRSDLSGLPDLSDLPDLKRKIAVARSTLENAHAMFGTDFAIVSSFGAESAVLLHLAASISTDIDVLFLNTGKLFGETKRYRDQLIDHLSLTRVHTLTPDTDLVTKDDPDGILWSQNNDHCCHIRKTIPLKKAIAPYKAWASGRKRYQSLERAALPHLEFSDEKLKINPLADWTSDDVDAYLDRFSLPRHPLVADGFASIGCMPCTDRVQDPSDKRSGRWQGMNKTECGIHTSSLLQDRNIA